MNPGVVSDAELFQDCEYNKAIVQLYFRLSSTCGDLMQSALLNFRHHENGFVMALKSVEEVKCFAVSMYMSNRIHVQSFYLCSITFEGEIFILY